MKKYGNAQGNSGVTAYESGSSHIKVVFQGHETYLYNEVRPGKAHVERMKQLADSGEGLSTYISQHVRTNYYKKLS